MAVNAMRAGSSIAKNSISQPLRSHRYVVEDWPRHRLSAPPAGYHWVQTGSDYLLVAIATGVIAQLLLNN